MKTQPMRRGRAHLRSTRPRLPEATGLHRTIFLSHRHEDGAVAIFLQAALAKCGITVHISERIQTGKEWRSEIEDQLARSTLLLFLYVDPSDDWDWCLYEVGFFAGLNKVARQKRTIAYIYPGSERPPQLTALQGVQATESAIEAFLIKSLLGRASARRAVAREIAQHLATHLGGSFSSRYLFPHFDVAVSPEWHRADSASAEGELPPDATIVAHNTSSEMFGISQPSARWGDLSRQTNTNSRNRNWGLHLARSLAEAAHPNAAPGGPRAIFHHNDRQYEAVPYCVRHRGNRATRFSLILLDASDRSEPIPTFRDLMNQVTHLLDDTAQSEDNEIDWLAYTPALGFLARSKDEWDILHTAMKAKVGQMNFACLPMAQLREFHQRFLHRRTLRGRISQRDIDEANDISAAILSDQCNSYCEIRWETFPQYYVFSNDRRAIVVTPLSMPGAGDQGLKETPEMFGAATHDRNVIKRVTRLHGRLLGRDERPPLQVGLPEAQRV